MQSSANFTVAPSNNLIRWFTRCFKEYFSVGPSFGRPKWLIKITLPPSANIFLIVGIVARMRLSSVITYSAFRGTLKSTRTKAFCPLKLCSENLLMINHLKMKKPQGRNSAEKINSAHLSLRFLK